VADAITEYSKAIEDGPAYCPCCNRIGQVYRRKVSHGMVVALVAFHNASGADRKWVHYGPTITKFRGQIPGIADYSKLKWWGLIEPKEALAFEKQAVREDEDKSSSGLWRITPRGQEFVSGYISIHEYCHVWDDRPRRFSGRELAFQQMASEAEGFKWSDLSVPDYTVGPGVVPVQMTLGV
jgi:hypothetical protein